jgi:hypothetical protein
MRGLLVRLDLGPHVSDNDSYVGFNGLHEKATRGRFHFCAALNGIGL